jgi:hypothetical protein
VSGHTKWADIRRNAILDPKFVLSEVFIVTRSRTHHGFAGYKDLLSNKSCNLNQARDKIFIPTNTGVSVELKPWCQRCAKQYMGWY